jgi:NADP-dependent 3-hydroxy acid dehydrogenase YdfG
MVSITDVRASNESLKSQPQGLVAVFAGATAGIGLHTLKQLSKYATAPRVYMIGRSRAKAATLLDELKVINPEGTYVFSEGEFSLVKDVDRFSEEIKKAEERVDILCMSPGYLSFAGREGKSSRY